jgi:transcriptional regulator with XRE-family HTH domain
MMAEIARHDLKLVDIAKALGISRSTLSSKIRGKSLFWADEVQTMQKLYFSDCTFDYLLQEDTVT